MIRCPYCGLESEHKLIKIWKYRWWDVYYYKCLKCGGKFRHQVDPEGRKKSYIIKVGVEGKRRNN